MVNNIIPPINGDVDEIPEPDDIDYTEDELDEINNNSFLILELLGNERGLLHQLIYIQRQIKIYDIYNHHLSNLYKNIYGHHPIRISTLTIRIYPNYTGISISFNQDDVIFRHQFITYLNENNIHFIMVEQDLFLDWSAVELLHNMIFNI
jgi:hypothetical protein